MTGRTLAALFGPLLVLSACGGDDPPPETTTTSEPPGQAIDELEPGACLIALPDGSTGRVETVDCALAHRAEVYAVHDLDGGPFPGAGPLNEEAARRCAERYDGYAGEPIDPTTDRAFAEIVPSPRSWEGGDRRVVCLALPAAGGSAEGSIAATPAEAALSASPPVRPADGALRLSAGPR